LKNKKTDPLNSWSNSLIYQLFLILKNKIISLLLIKLFILKTNLKIISIISLISRSNCIILLIILLIISTPISIKALPTIIKLLKNYLIILNRFVKTLIILLISNTILRNFL
jgi:hypothetical protein